MKETQREKLIRLLKSIGFSIRHHGANHWYIYTSKNKFTGYLLYGETDTRIEHTLEDYAGGMSFYLKHCVVKMLDEYKETVTVYPKGNKNVFILFSNFDLKNDTKSTK